MAGLRGNPDRVRRHRVHERHQAHPVPQSHHPTATALRRVRLLVRGRVQGVGFRPAIYRAMTERDCAGSVRNTPEGVVLEVEGERQTVQRIVDGFSDLIPARARVDEVM